MDRTRLSRIGPRFVSNFDGKRQRIISRDKMIVCEHLRSAPPAWERQTQQMEDSVEMSGIVVELDTNKTQSTSRRMTR